MSAKRLPRMVRLVPMVVSVAACASTSAPSAPGSSSQSAQGESVTTTVLPVAVAGTPSEIKSAESAGATVSFTTDPEISNSGREEEEPTVAIPPGECWVKTAIYPIPRRDKVEVVVRDAANRFVVVPAKLMRSQETVVVREGGVTYRIEPPVYREVKERILVRPEIRRTVAIPPVYEKRRETVVVEAERTVFERCPVAGVMPKVERSAQPVCARVLPAKTKTIVREVLVRPATTREEVIPAQYREVSRWVLERPAQAIPIDLPPVTRKVTTVGIKEPEVVREEQVPAKAVTLTQTVFEGKAKVALRRALCTSEVTAELVRSLQTALRAAGYDPGRIDGRLGSSTVRALVSYQRDHGLAVGAVTHETLEHLGIRPGS